MDDQIKELTKLVMELRIDLAKMDTKMDSFKDMQHKIEDHSSRLTSVEASSKSAHLRMDKIDKIHFWILTTTGAILLGGIGAFILKGGLIK